MKFRWSPTELDLYWTLSPEEMKLLRNKTGATRLGFAVLLKFFQQECRFPENPREIPSAAINHLALQTEVPFLKWRAYRWEGRTIKYHRAKIREWFGYREVNRADVNHLKI